MSSTLIRDILLFIIRVWRTLIYQTCQIDLPIEVSVRTEITLFCLWRLFLFLIYLILFECLWDKHIATEQYAKHEIQNLHQSVADWLFLSSNLQLATETFQNFYARIMKLHKSVVEICGLCMLLQRNTVIPIVHARNLTAHPFRLHSFGKASITNFSTECQMFFKLIQSGYIYFSGGKKRKIRGEVKINSDTITLYVGNCTQTFRKRSIWPVSGRFSIVRECKIT